MRILALALVLVVSTEGCKRKEEEIVDSPSPATRAPAVSGGTRDAVPTGGALREGKLRAYGLTLPVGFEVRTSFNNHVLATGPATQDQVVAYVAKQIGKPPPEKTKLNFVSFKGVTALAEPTRPLEILIQRDAASVGWVKIDVDDLSPPPQPPPDKRDPKSRMEAIGVTPDGRLLNP